MAKKYFGFLLILSGFFSVNIYAQKRDKQSSFGFGVETGLPVSKDLNYFSSMAGITVRGSYKMGPGFITLTGGAIAFIPKNLREDFFNFGIQVPLKGGYKYIFANRFFLHPEIGYAEYYVIYKNGNNATDSDRNNAIVLGPAAGINFGIMELALRYENALALGSKAGGTTSLQAICLRFGFNF